MKQTAWLLVLRCRLPRSGDTRLVCRTSGEYESLLTIRLVTIPAGPKSGRCHCQAIRLGSGLQRLLHSSQSGDELEHHSAPSHELTTASGIAPFKSGAV